MQKAQRQRDMEFAKRVHGKADLGETKRAIAKGGGSLRTSKAPRDPGTSAGWARNWIQKIGTTAKVSAPPWTRHTAACPHRHAALPSHVPFLSRGSILPSNQPIHRPPLTSTSLSPLALQHATSPSWRASLAPPPTHRPAPREEALAQRAAEAISRAQAITEASSPYVDGPADPGRLAPPKRVAASDARALRQAVEDARERMQRGLARDEGAASAPYPEVQVGEDPDYPRVEHDEGEGGSARGERVARERSPSPVGARGWADIRGPAGRAKEAWAEEERERPGTGGMRSPTGARGGTASWAKAPPMRRGGSAGEIAAERGREGRGGARKTVDPHVAAIDSVAVHMAEELESALREAAARGHEPLVSAGLRMGTRGWFKAQVGGRRWMELRIASVESSRAMERSERERRLGMESAGEGNAGPRRPWTTKRPACGCRWTRKCWSPSGKRTRGDRRRSFDTWRRR